MKKKLFPGFPSNFLLASVPFIYLGIYLYYISIRSSKLLSIEFYTLNLVPMLALLGIHGRQLFDRLGMDLNHAPTYIRLVRLIILVVVGALLGFGIYYFSSSFARLNLFPFDLWWMQLKIDSPIAVSVLDVGIVAFFEEVIRGFGTLGYANTLYKKLKDKDDAILYGTLLSSLFFVLLHIYSWQTTNALSYLVMSAVVSAFTFSGWILRSKGVFGNLAFMEFSIIPGMVAHFIYDLSINLSLRVSPGLLSLVYLRLFPI